MEKGEPMTGYLTVASLADYLDFKGTPRGKQAAARAWMTRTGIPKYWRGKCWVVKVTDVDKCLRGESPSAA